MKQEYIIFFTAVNKTGRFRAKVPVFNIKVEGTTKEETTANAHQAVRDKFPNAIVRENFYGGTVTVPDEA